MFFQLICRRERASRAAAAATPTNVVCFSSFFYGKVSSRIHVIYANCRLCFVFFKIQTTVIHGEEGKNEKTEKVESLVDGPVCSNRCIIRKTIAAFFDHVRLLRILEQRSVGVLACAIGRNITLINANNVSLQLELSAEEEKNKEKDKEDLKANLQSETVSETLAAAEAMTTDMFNTFETFLSRIEINDEVRKERTEEQAKIIK